MVMMKQSFVFRQYCATLVLCTLIPYRRLLFVSTSFPTTYFLTFLFRIEVKSLETSQLITMSGSVRSRNTSFSRAHPATKGTKVLTVLSFHTQSSHKTIQAMAQTKMKPLLNWIGILRLRENQPALLCRRPYAVIADVRLPGKIQKLIRS